MDNVPVDLKTLTLSQLVDLVESLGEPSFRARQIYGWLHNTGVKSVDEMVNVPASLRELLRDQTRIDSFELVSEARGQDGTVKYLFRLPSGNCFETVQIPDFDTDSKIKRVTVCVSSQVGCAMGCTFCATGTMGFRENLSAGMIVDQVRITDQVARESYGRGVTNVVFMGMGEPLLNYEQVALASRILTDRKIGGLSHRRVTLSTVGLAKQIERLANDELPVNLAVSRCMRLMMRSGAQSCRSTAANGPIWVPCDRLFSTMQEYPENVSPTNIACLMDSTIQYGTRQTWLESYRGRTAKSI